MMTVVSMAFKDVRSVGTDAATTSPDIVLQSAHIGVAGTNGTGEGPIGKVELASVDISPHGRRE